MSRLGSRRDWIVDERSPILLGMERLAPIWQRVGPLLDQRHKDMLWSTLDEIRDSEAPQWGTKESWNAWLDDLEAAAGQDTEDELRRVVLGGYIRVRFYYNHRNDPPLGSKEDHAHLVSYTADDLRRRLAES